MKKLIHEKYFEKTESLPENDLSEIYISVWKKDGFIEDQANIDLGNNVYVYDNRNSGRFFGKPFFAIKKIQHTDNGQHIIINTTLITDSIVKDRWVIFESSCSTRRFSKHCDINDVKISESNLLSHDEWCMRKSYYENWNNKYGTISKLNPLFSIDNQPDFKHQNSLITLEELKQDDKSKRYKSLSENNYNDMEEHKKYGFPDDNLLSAFDGDMHNSWNMTLSKILCKR